MAGPSTTEQLVLLALFVLPGISYQFVRERSRGLVPGERDIGERLLRAFFTSVITIAVCGLFAGTTLLAFITPVNGVWFAKASAHSSQACALVLVLLVVLPASAAWAVNWRCRRTGKDIYPGQSLWDRVLEKGNSGLVRARLKNGDWVAGWYDHGSVARTRSDSELFLSIEHCVDADGQLGPPMELTAGVYINLQDVDIVEFIKPLHESILLKGAIV